MKLFATLRFKILLSYVLVVLFALSVTAFFLDRSLEKHALQDLHSSIGIQAGLIAAQLDLARLEKEDTPYLDAFVTKSGRITGSRVTVVSASGRVLGDSQQSYTEILKMENHLNRPEIIKASGHEAASVTRYSHTLKKEMLYLAVPVRDGQRVAGFVRLAIPMARVKRVMSSLRRTIIFSFLISALFALATGWLVVWLTAAPFGEIISGSKRFASGDFTCRIPLRSSGELRELAETLNSMAAEISRRMREAELRRLELEAAFRDMSEAIVVTDGAGVVTRMNPRAELLMKARGMNVPGMRLTDISVVPGLAEAALKALSGGSQVSREIESEAGLVLSVIASPIKENGGVGGCVLVARDITEPRRLENMRREFVANVSHELKTPLTAIRGCAETLLNGAFEDKESGPAFARTIHEQAVRLDNLVNDILKISYAESGRAVLERSVFQLKDLAVDSVRAVKTLFEKKQIDFTEEVPGGLVVNADRDKIFQVMINLLHNAAKFSREKGSVKISAIDLGREVKVTVEDSGSGIPETHLSRIFERFYRVDKARSRELGGTGLGLSIVKHLVELHGGRAGVESAEAQGSKFWFVLPK